MKFKLIVLVIVSLVLGIGVGVVGTRVVDKSNSAATDKAELVETNSDGSDQVKTFAENMKVLRSKQGKEFDKEFITLMMGSSQDAITMASFASEQADKKEVKAFADSTRETQIDNINQLKSWYSEWGFLLEDQENNPDIH
ncbi:MAG: DUF305 domain-containing protein [Candidatus Nomurabacteria bacterium]|nr:MAG: DUF305 domain-containing protein [Candidatus Nomurabacteria bacterium]